MVGAAKRGYRDDRLAPVRPLPLRQRLQRGDALILEVLADDEDDRTAARIGRHQDAPVAPAIAQLHRVGDIADADIALRGRDDLARLDPAAALNELAIEARIPEKADAIRHEMRLIDRHRDRIDHAASLVLGP